jgi:sarcosine oxidase subunit gamma
MADQTPPALSPLSRFPEAAGTPPGTPAPVTLREHPFRGLVNLRLDPADTAVLRAAEAVLGLALPLQPNRCAEGAGRSVLWLGPDEFLVMCEAGGETALADGLSHALSGRHAAVTDISDGRAVIEIGGARARDLLAKGCGLDLHPRVFGPGQCAQSGFAKARIIIRQRDPAPVFEIVVERSHAEYLWLWLQDATREFAAGAPR